MSSSVAFARPDSGFVDALAGADGTGDPPPTVWRVERFSDALAAPEADPAPMPPTVLPLSAPAAAALAAPAPAPPSAGRRAAGATHQRNAAARAARQGSPVAVPAPPIPGAPPFAPAAHPPVAPYVVMPAAAARSSMVPVAAAPVASQYTLPVASQYTALPYQPAQRSSTPPPATRPPARRPVSHPGAQPTRKKKSGASGFLTLLVFILIALFASGAGRGILNALSDLFGQ